MVTVRRATPADAAHIAAYQVAMAQETQGLALEPDVVARGVRAVFDDAAKGEYWVAGLEGRTVACLLTVAEWSDWRNATVMWIHSVYVTPGARRQGVFTAMYLHLRGLVMASPGLAGLRLYTERDNHAAQSVYEGLGMSREHYHLYEWLPSEDD